MEGADEVFPLDEVVFPLAHQSSSTNTKPREDLLRPLDQKGLKSGKKGGLNSAGATGRPTNRALQNAMSKVQENEAQFLPNVPPLSAMFDKGKAGSSSKDALSPYDGYDGKSSQKGGNNFFPPSVKGSSVNTSYSNGGQMVMNSGGSQISGKGGDTPGSKGGPSGGKSNFPPNGMGYGNASYGTASYEAYPKGAYHGGGKVSDLAYHGGGKVGKKGGKNHKNGLNQSSHGGGPLNSGSSGGNAESEEKKRPEETQGMHLVCKKHSSMGCALITFAQESVRDLVLRHVLGRASLDPNDPMMRNVGAHVNVGGVQVSVKPRTEKDTGSDVPTDIFVGWGRQAQLRNPISGEVLCRFFDDIVSKLDLGEAFTEEVYGREVDESVESGGQGQIYHSVESAGGIKGSKSPPSNSSWNEHFGAQTQQHQTTHHSSQGKIY